MVGISSGRGSRRRKTPACKKRRTRRPFGKIARWRSMEQRRPTAGVQARSRRQAAKLQRLAVKMEIREEEKALWARQRKRARAVWYGTTLRGRHSEQALPGKRRCDLGRGISVPVFGRAYSRGRQVCFLAGFLWEIIKRSILPCPRWPRLLQQVPLPAFLLPSFRESTVRRLGLRF